jgi:hypothetical protein
MAGDDGASWEESLVVEVETMESELTQAPQPDFLSPSAAVRCRAASD